MRLPDDRLAASARFIPRWLLGLTFLLGLGLTSALSPAEAALPRPLTNEALAEADAGSVGVEAVQYRRRYYAPQRRYYRPRGYYGRRGGYGGRPRYYRRY